MSHFDPYRHGRPPRRASSPNGLGIAGFVVSLVGLIVTCGVLCPLGVLLSLMAMFRRPRGLAMAGLIIGLVGTLFMAGGLFLFFGTILAAARSAELQHSSDQTEAVLREAEQKIEIERVKSGELPDGVEGNKLLLELSDGWENPIQYERVDDVNYTVRSAGLDGRFHTRDDLTEGPDMADQPAEFVDQPDILNEEFWDD